jgi:hypothetical protein
MSKNSNVHVLNNIHSDIWVLFCMYIVYIIYKESNFM